MIFGISFLLLFILIIGFYMAWNIGANDLANSMASSVGAQAVTLRNAVILGGILAFIGAVFVGSNVADTIRKGIIDPENAIFVENQSYLLYGAISALLGASFWITIATWKELPISTTHSIVGGMMGFGVAAGGPGIVDWEVVGKIVASWGISPVLGGVFAYLMFNIVLRFILRNKDPIKATQNLGPIFVALTFVIIASSILLKSPLGARLDFSLTELILTLFIVFIISIIIGRIILTGFFSKNKKTRKMTRRETYKMVEKIFSRLQLMTACYVAFALGANDVANAIGPMATAFSIETTGSVGTQVELPLLLLGLGGIGIVVGMMTWGYKVIKTIGTKITYLTNTRGFSIEFGAATSVLLASKLGMPVSTTHAVVGAVIGVGLARGLQAIDLSIIKKIVVTWFVTVPIAAVTAGGLFLLMITIFG
jgi:PiT family inorganic phosphate transporter